jgi:hypothetical protein
MGKTYRKPSHSFDEESSRGRPAGRRSGGKLKTINSYVDEDLFDDDDTFEDDIEVVDEIQIHHTKNTP